MAEPARGDRRYPHEDDGRRSAYERDRDAIMYTTAFRRLAGVTQVVSPTEGQIYHNRLTHTLEVAQIARGLVQEFRRVNPALVGHLEIDQHVVEAGALAHDLGHPPFGHVAEKELNEAVQQAGDIDGYEGNAQSFRIITTLAVRNEAPGLNLTRASLNATLKYPHLQELTDAATAGHGKPTAKQVRRKWGAYQSERDDLQFARAQHDPSDSKGCLEAQIMDWADDIAYSLHDSEDFYRAGLVPLHLLSTDDGFIDTYLEKVLESRKDKGVKSAYSENDLATQFRIFCSGMPFSKPYEPTREARAMLRGFLSFWIGRYITSTELLAQPDEDGRWLKVSPEVEMQVEMLKELTWQFVIKGPSMIGMQHGQRSVVRSLFEIFAEAVLSNDHHGKWSVLPARDRVQLLSLREHYGKEIPQRDRIRVAADAIAGMTDDQAILMHHRLTGISSGSVLDAIVT